MEGHAASASTSLVLLSFSAAFLPHLPMPPRKRVNSTSVQVAPLSPLGTLPTSPQTKRPLLYYIFIIISLTLLWGYAQERVGAQPYCEGEGAARQCERFVSIPVMNLIQAVFATVTSYCCIWLMGARYQRVGSVWDLLPASTSHTIASPMGYSALGYINFPLYILVSSCKLIPVLLAGVLVNRKPRPLQDYFSALLMTEGVLLYSIVQAASGEKSGGHAQTWDSHTKYFLGFPLTPLACIFVGVALTVSNLLLEGFTNASQDRVNLIHREAGKKGVPSIQMMADMNLISSVLLFVGLSVEFFVSGERSYLLTALSFAQRHPAVMFNILLFSTCGSVAQVFIFGCLEEYGGFLTTTICTTRKIVQVLLSVAIFGHKVEFIQWLGIVNVFAGLAIQTYCGGGGLELAFVEHPAAAAPAADQPAPITREQKKAA